MFVKLLLFDKNTIIGMFTVVKNNHTIIEVLIDKYELLYNEMYPHIKENIGIQEIGVDFKGISTFCTTILSSLQWVWQILHISLKEQYSA